MNPMLVAKAYGAVQKQVSGLHEEGSRTHDVGAAFSKVLNGAMEQTMKSTQNAESQMIAHSQGKAELIDAVTAVATAEASLESVIAIRDQVISAYQEILRMPI
ncbi:flagellar hook-basal body complex protein FliE [Asticcacaulis excentricus]|uniref:Flagellar hook-basal body complex protein FliE n=1 Tax=Asticcacaulis excentricus TaxID=78587 RepID=A0A3G9FYQ1_9CAUL|nr:flagellar hook-basal body complex protein FliE [Asticcacaulis excentricus]BBF80190.1 flagellar hook-basal body complex protein FliE [Asticcacaulis excentricus]